MASAQTVQEMVDSLTGFEEERIESHFGRDISFLLSTNASKSIRSLIFIDKIREGMTSETADESKVVAAAKKYAQGLTIGQVNTHFPDEDEGDPFGIDAEGDEPTSEAGKGGSDAGSQPEN